MTFADDRREFFEGVVLGSDAFERLCTYQPAAGGEARSVRANVRATEDQELGEYSLDQLDAIVVTVAREPAAACGGVDAPEAGDLLTTPEGRTYAFTGQVLGQTPYSWRLRFERRTQRLAGAQSQRR